MRSCTVTTTGARAGGPTKFVAWTTSTGPVQRSIRGVAACCHSVRTRRAGIGRVAAADAGRHHGGELRAAAEGDGVHDEVEFVALGERVDERRGGVTDAGTDAEERCAVERDA